MDDVIPLAVRALSLVSESDEVEKSVDERDSDSSVLVPDVVDPGCGVPGPSSCSPSVLDTGNLPCDAPGPSSCSPSVLDTGNLPCDAPSPSSCLSSTCDTENSPCMFFFEEDEDELDTDDELEDTSISSPVTPFEKLLEICSFSVNIEEKQRDDPDIGKVYRWLEKKVEPSQQDLYLSCPAVRHLWLCRSQLEMKNGILYYKWEGNVNERFLLVVPDSLKKMVLQHCHDELSGGHLCFKKTLKKVKQSFYWVSMRNDVLQHVRACSVCARMKHANLKSRAAMVNFHAGAVCERVHIDLMGAIPSK